MKFKVGKSEGQAIPRILNPLCFLFMALACFVGAAAFGICMVLLLIMTPFSLLTRIKIVE